MGSGFRVYSVSQTIASDTRRRLRFSAKIIDAHTHLGQWTPDKADFKASTLSRALNQLQASQKNQNEVEYALVSSLSCIDKAKGLAFTHSEEEGSTLLLQECAQDKRLKPLIVCQPGAGSAVNVQKVLQTHPGAFYGFKFHTMGLGFPANDPRYYPYLQLAQAHHLPCVFHTDQVGSYGDPKLIYDLAKRFPTVPVVLYHMSMAPGCQVKNLTKTEIESRHLQGQEEKFVWEVRETWNRDGIRVVQEAVAKQDVNLYLEVSWVKPETVVEAIKTVGADRVLYGSDAPLGDYGREGIAYRKNIEEIQQAIRQAFSPTQAEAVIQKVFYDNAYRLFFQQHPHSKPSPTPSVSSSLINSSKPSTKGAQTKPIPQQAIPTWAKLSLVALPLVGGGAYWWSSRPLVPAPVPSPAVLPSPVNRPNPVSYFPVWSQGYPVTSYYSGYFPPPMQMRPNMVL